MCSIKDTTSLLAAQQHNSFLIAMKIRMKIPKTARRQRASSSAEVVASIDDLLLQILLGLPIRSVIRFKSVSKHWLTLISSTPQFAIKYKLYNPQPTGLLLRSNIINDGPSPMRFEYVNFDIQNPTPAPFSTQLFSSLAMVYSYVLVSNLGAAAKKFHVFNPTTKQSTVIPMMPNRGRVHGVGLAFDPAKSPAYKVVCIRDSDLVPGLYQIEIYNSENGTWRVSGEPFKANHDFKNGVYCNGAIHWLCNWRYDNFLYFNVDEERLGEMPPLYTSEWQSGDLTYFGESDGHLHFMEFYCPPQIIFELEMNEMKRDYSGWFVKYRVNLSAASLSFPEMIPTDLRPWNYQYYLVNPLAVVRGEKEEDAFVVLEIPGKAIRYNLLTQTFHKLCDFAEAAEGIKGWLRFDDSRGYQFIQSLSHV